VADDADPGADGDAEPVAAPDEEPTFAVPSRPERRFTDDGGVEYEGETVFALTPEPSRSDDELAALVETVLDGDPYRHGDWFELPMPLYLVRDDAAGDTFRVAVRDGRVELHVLPDTGRAGLRAFYDRLADASTVDWRVACRADG